MISQSKKMWPNFWWFWLDHGMANAYDAGNKNKTQQAL